MSESDLCDCLDSRDMHENREGKCMAKCWNDILKIWEQCDCLVFEEDVE